MTWLSRRWLAFAVAATAGFVVLGLAYDAAGVDTNIDTGDHTAGLVLLIALLIASVGWYGVVLHALRDAFSRLRQR